MKPNKCQHEIILQWLNVGAIESDELNKLLPDPCDDLTDEEVLKESRRLKLYFSRDYCSRMKDVGKCILYNECKPRR